MTLKSLSLSFGLGGRLKSKNACMVGRAYLVVTLTEQKSGNAPRVKHTTASELRVGWNANHERSFGLLERMMVHVERRRT